MLKNIATARSECTTIYENNTNHIISDFIDFFDIDSKQTRKQIERRNNCEKICVE